MKFKKFISLGLSLSALMGMNLKSVFAVNFEDIKNSVILVFIEEEAEKNDLLDFVNKNGILS